MGGALSLASLPPTHPWSIPHTVPLAVVGQAQCRQGEGQGHRHGHAGGWGRDHVPGPAHSLPRPWPADGCGQLSCVCSLTSTLVELTSCRHGATCWDQLEGVKLSPRSFHLLGDWEGVTTLRPHRAWGGLEGPDAGCGASSGPGRVMRVLAVTGRPWPREEPWAGRLRSAGPSERPRQRPQQTACPGGLALPSRPPPALLPPLWEAEGNTWSQPGTNRHCQERAKMLF